MRCLIEPEPESPDPRPKPLMSIPPCGAIGKIPPGHSTHTCTPYSLFRKHRKMKILKLDEMHWLGLDLWDQPTHTIQLELSVQMFVKFVNFVIRVQKSNSELHSGLSISIQTSFTTKKNIHFKSEWS